MKTQAIIDAHMGGRHRPDNLEFKKKRAFENKQKNCHGRVLYALRTGKLKKKPCEVCGEENVHGHHDDYDKPLEVRWLCPPHHKEADRARRNNSSADRHSSS